MPSKVWDEITYTILLQRYHRRRLGIDKQLNPTLYNGYNYLSTLGLKGMLLNEPLHGINSIIYSKWYQWIRHNWCNVWNEIHTSIMGNKINSHLSRNTLWPINAICRHTVYPKKYAHGFCFAVPCCGYTLTDLPISIRLTSLALWQSNDCPSASKATLMNMDKYFMWIHYERLHNQNKAKHNKTVCIFLGIYCRSGSAMVQAMACCLTPPHHYSTSVDFSLVIFLAFSLGSLSRRVPMLLFKLYV